MMKSVSYHGVNAEELSQQSELYLLNPKCTFFKQYDFFFSAGLVTDPTTHEKCSHSTSEIVKLTTTSVLRR